MKYKGQGRKEVVIMRFNDYINKWEVWSKPLTIKQARDVLIVKNPNYYKIEFI